jgi:hypothetical protein
MKKNTQHFLLTILFVSFFFHSCVDSIETEFKNPPDWAKPHTWWHWVDGNVSKEGITKDMEAWKTVGIGGFQHFSLGWRIPFGGIDYNSPEYHENMVHAFNEAERLGLEAAFNSASGWSCTGGPWITPEHSMKMIVWSETKIKGGSEKSIELQLPDLNEKQQAYNFYRDIAVMAFPTPQNDQYRLENWEAKSLTDLKARSDKFIPTFVQAPRDAVIAVEDVQNITDEMDSNGVLAWDAPDGNWTVLRIGYTTTAATTKPPAKGGLGLEIDKMSRTAADIHWDELVEKIILDANGKKALTTILIDSYEVGHQNWTDDFPQLFKSHCKYDIIPNLLCMTGRIVESTDYTERVLWDVRNTVAELTYQNFFLYFKEKCQQQGFLLACEPYGTGSFDALKVAKIADLKMTEFWIRETPWFRRNLWEWTGQVVSSAAHLTGDRVVGAEAFTRMQGDWTAHPYSMKIKGDRAFANGVNRYIFHSSVHQPFNDMVKPGITMGQFGTQFHRNNTWFSKSKEWLTYISRCQYLMQKGNYVSDILVLYGDDQGFVNFIGQNEPVDMAYISGYRFDLGEIGTLENLSVDNDGMIRVSHNGTLLENRYKLLLLKRADLMKVESVELLGKLARQGAKIFAPRPKQTPGLTNSTKGDEQLLKLIEKYWDSGLISTPDQYDLALAKIQPDCELPDSTEYCHHTIDGNSYYFVSNQTYTARKMNCRFRVTGKLPEIWHPETGDIYPAPSWKTTAGGRTEVDLDLTEAESIFVVFRKKTSKKSGSTPSPTYKEITQLGNSWNVSFDKHYVPKGQITLDKLIPLNEHTDFDVSHFSGTATYKTTFQVVKVDQPMFIDLGDVQVIAEIKLNGKKLKTLWKPPFRVEISDVVQSGENNLEIKVTNLWVNRLIGDEYFPAWDGRNNGAKKKRGTFYDSFPNWLVNGDPMPKDDKKAFSAWCHWTKDDKLLKSGLIGPVKIITLETNR